MNNAISKKNNIINYPILLLSIHVILNLGGLASSVVSFFKTVFQNPLGIISSILSLALSFFTIILLVLLILNWMKKLDNGNRIIGAVIIVAEVIALYFAVTSIIRNRDMFGYFIESPLVSWFVNIFISIFVLWSGLLIIKGKKPNKSFFVLFCAVIFLLAVRSIFEAFQYDARVMGILESLLYVTLFFNLPNLFNESTIAKTAITKKKIISLAIVAAILLCIFAVTDSSTIHDGQSNAEGVCRSCGRSWEAGDSGGNYKNIARTGMCNNCEDNYHSMKDFLE